MFMDIQEHGGAHEAVDQGNTIEHDCGAGAREHEVFDRCFRRKCIASNDTDEHDEAHGHQLEADVQGDEITGCGEDHHPEGGENEQDGNILLRCSLCASHNRWSRGR